MGLTRRTALLGAAGATVGIGGAGLLVEAGVLPGRGAVRRALGACEVNVALPALPPVPVTIGRFRSAARSREVGYAVLAPRDATDLPVCVFLHGRGGDHADVGGEGVGLPWHLAAYLGAQNAPFALVGVDGGETYWHRRVTGDDPPAMITDELLPLLRGKGFRTDRIALLGVSMGGYGALLLGQRLGRRRVAAVGAISPALFRSAAADGVGAFDDAADYAANDVFAGRDRLAGIPTRIDCGLDDPFADATRAFLAGAPGTVGGAVTKGCHDGRFWRSVAGAHVGVIGSTLAR